MSSHKLMEKIKIMQQVLPLADGFNTTACPVLDMSEYQNVRFIIQFGVIASAADITFAVLACNDATPAQSAAAAFDYSYNTGVDKGNVQQAMVQNVTTLNLVVADGAASKLLLIECDGARLQKALGATYAVKGVQLTITENVNKTVAGAVVAELWDAKHCSKVQDLPVGTLV
jgi:hypothetical protein